MAYSILPPPARSTSKLLRKRRSQKKKIKVFGALITAGFIFFVFSIVAVAVAFGYFAKDLPSPNKLTDRTPTQSTQIMDRNGTVLYRVFGDKNRTLVTLDKVPKYLREATIATEDKNFYTHQGFDWLAIIRAMRDLIVNKRLEGGSTLTQQLVKNALLSNERTVTRKIKEVILSVQIERRYTKDEILQIYLNEIPYGGTAWGVEAASQQYFGKDVWKLDLAESAVLAGLPQAPSAYSPFGSDPKAYVARSTYVLQRMLEDGYIDQKQEQAAIKELPILQFSQFGQGISAPHFSLYVKKLLEDKYGEQMVLQGGLQVTTSLDLNLQTQVEKIVKDTINAPENKRLRVGNGAAVVEDSKNGEILAMVGSKDYFASDIQGNFDVATQGLRQPGSSLKPFNYLTGFEKGYTPSTLWLDQKTDFGGGYTPLNYDSNYFAPGQTRYVLANSLNIPAVEHLATIGLNSMLSTLSNFGITTLKDPSKYGLSLTLGGGAIKLYELTNAYAILGNSGKYHDSVTILKVTDSSGKVLEEYKPKDGPQLAPPQDVYLIQNILSDRNAKSQGYGTYWANRLHFKDNIGVKTGTSEYKTDNWTFGFTTAYTVGVWVGNNDNSPMNPALASGVTGAAPLYHDIMALVLGSGKTDPFPRPANVIDAQVDALTGMLPGPNNQGAPTRTEVFDKNNPPQVDDMHVKVRICQPSGLLASPACEAAGQAVDKIYVVMYDPYQKMFPDRMHTYCNPCPPSQMDSSVTAPPSVSKPSVAITMPNNGQIFANKSNVVSSATISGGPTPYSSVTFTLTNKTNTSSTTAKTATGPPYQVTFNNVATGSYYITVTVVDSQGNSTVSDPVSFTVL